MRSAVFIDLLLLLRHLLVESGPGRLLGSVQFTSIGAAFGVFHDSFHG